MIGVSCEHTKPARHWFASGAHAEVHWPGRAMLPLSIAAHAAAAPAHTIAVTLEGADGSHSIVQMPPRTSVRSQRSEPPQSLGSEHACPANPGNPSGARSQIASGQRQYVPSQVHWAVGRTPSMHWTGAIVHVRPSSRASHANVCACADDGVGHASPPSGRYASHASVEQRHRPPLHAQRSSAELVGDASLVSHGTLKSQLIPSLEQGSPVDGRLATAHAPPSWSSAPRRRPVGAGHPAITSASAMTVVSRSGSVIVVARPLDRRMLPAPQ